MSDSLSSLPPTIRYSELRQKEIINICTCRTLGCISDLELDPRNGSIDSLIASCGGKFGCFFGKECEYRIPWCKISRIGDDIILVDIDEDKARTLSD